MDELEKLNSTITSEANKILYDRGLLGILGKYGNPVPTGSYVLGLMTWRDLDIYLETNEMTEKRFFQLGEEIALGLKPQRMHYRNEFIGKTPNLPVGFYWGIYIISLDFPEEWKIDIWAIDANQTTKLQKELEDLKSKIAKNARPIILKIKNHFCKHPEYRRTFTSMDIYHAVIEEDIKSTKEFSKWLQGSRGVLSETS